MYAVFTRKLIDGEAQVIEFIAQPVGIGRGQIAELVDAAGKPCNIVAQVADELLVFRDRANVSDFGSQPLRFARHAF
ncbi:hypothetical protein D3C87_1796820 [compost metagenome]